MRASDTDPIRPKDWWRSPSLCYGEGLRAGYQMGREDAYREIFGGLLEGLRVAGERHRDGTPLTLRQAIDQELKLTEQAAHRRAWDEAVRSYQEGGS